MFGLQYVRFIVAQGWRVVKHYIFANKAKLIEKISENLEIKFDIQDIKIK